MLRRVGWVGGLSRLTKIFSENLGASSWGCLTGGASKSALWFLLMEQDSLPEFLEHTFWVWTILVNKSPWTDIFWPIHIEWFGRVSRSAAPFLGPPTTGVSCDLFPLVRIDWRSFKVSIAGLQKLGALGVLAGAQ